ncbi:MAG: hypothetical protein LBQ22_05430 [Bacteroidales bacterium]|jgi:hypothetical protein|nr:hypothetical protein [Bacteroidales bacterium]
MKRSFLTLLISAILLLQGYGQTTCDIRDHYEDFIIVSRFSYNDNYYLVKRIVETNKESCISGLVNNNINIFDYLLTHFYSNTNYQELLMISDSLSLHKAYISDLKNDSLFNSVMYGFVNKTLEKTLPKDTVTFDDLLNIAVKYFSIIRLNDEGNYVGKVCAGLNDIKKTEEERKPYIEAFCFSSIIKHYQSEEFSMYDEFVKSIRELYKVNLGIDQNERLLRAQGAMFLLMRNNENLKKMLKSEYEKNKEYLPFILAEK